MSQYNSRIYIKVKSIEDWKKLSDIDFKEFGFVENPFKGYDKPVFEIDVGWSCYEDDLESIACEITERIPDCFLIGDTTNINVDPYAFIAYYLGDCVECEEIECELQWETQLDEPFEWFAEAGIELDEKQKGYLKKFGFN